MICNKYVTDNKLMSSQNLWKFLFHDERIICFNWTLVCLKYGAVDTTFTLKIFSENYKEKEFFGTKSTYEKFNKKLM